jgi:hypothetical protein
MASFAKDYANLTRICEFTRRLHQRPEGAIPTWPSPARQRDRGAVF